MPQPTLATILTPGQIRTVEAVAADVKQRQLGESSGHDWSHTLRVWNLALVIAQGEGADPYSTSLAAIAHDVADWKFFPGTDADRANATAQLLRTHGVDEQTCQHVLTIVSEVSFLGGGVKRPMSSIEGQAVQDADRLDAIGAIGIARCFAFGGAKGRSIYDPAATPRTDLTETEYKSRDSGSIGHFYDKLLLLRNLMNTATGKALADQRHAVLEQFLHDFHQEWDEDHRYVNV